MPNETGFPETTTDAVLGGRLMLRQPKRGHRVGHDAILLAAATPSLPGDRAVDLGAGVGAAGLALARRVEGLRVTLVEIDPALCALAEENATANDLADRVTVLNHDVKSIGRDFSAERVLMNPPFNDPARMQVSPEAARARAHVAEDDTLRTWIAAAARILVSGGSLTLIWRAEDLAAVESAVADSFGDVRILPVVPRAGAAAIRVLVHATKDGGTSRAVLPDLVLNGPDGRPTPAAEAVLRSGETLPLARI